MATTTITNVKQTKQRKRKSSGGLSDAVYPVVTIIIVLLIWQVLVVALKVPRYMIPAPFEIFAEFFRSASLLAQQGFVTLYEILLGFLVAVVVGMALAVLIVSWRLFEKCIFPLLVASQTMPKVAVAPLFLIWFGFGLVPKILVAFLIAFFPIVIDTVIGLRSVHPDLLYLGRISGASRFQTFFKIRIPNALPNIFGGLKIAITMAVVGAIVGEFIGADKGLGRLLLIANAQLDMALLFADVALLTAMGIVLFTIIDILEKFSIPWHVSQREGAHATM